MSKLGFSKDASHERWLATTVEQVLEPSIEIVDAHHHLWHRPDGGSYLFPEFLADLNQGHRVISTVYAECHSMYRTEGEEQLKSVGESEFVAGVSAMSASGNYGETAVCQVMFAHTDMTLGTKSITFWMRMTGQVEVGCAAYVFHAVGIRVPKFET